MTLALFAYLLGFVVAAVCYRYASQAWSKSLWPIWRTIDASASAFDAPVLADICLAEQNTQRVLEDQGLCLTCAGGDGGGGNKCLPPYSLVLFARYTVGDLNFTLSCNELSAQWADVKDATVAQLVTCVADLKLSSSSTASAGLPASCPAGFSPVLVDELFGTSGTNAGGGGTNTIARYTSSVFATNGDVSALYDHAGDYDRAGGSAAVRGKYDTASEDFVSRAVDASLVSDMTLALGSAVVTALAMLVHTRSPWLTSVALCQIILSFPIAYFVYSLVARLQFFPFLNFIGIFVTFALGADDAFVAVDKWKNARLDHRGATTEQIAAIALPDAAAAMFLTTVRGVPLQDQFLHRVRFRHSPH